MGFPPDVFQNEDYMYRTWTAVTTADMDLFVLLSILHCALSDCAVKQRSKDRHVRFAVGFLQTVQYLDSNKGERVSQRERA